MSFVKTPSGVIMHVENHRKAVELAKKNNLKGMLLMLEPAEPVLVHATDELASRRVDQPGGGDPPQRSSEQERAK